MYLRLAFNQIYQRARDDDAAIIPCGGPTNCSPPYEGTEARTISTYLKTLMDREAVAGVTKKWRILEEDQSLSSLENLVFAANIIKQHNLSGHVTIFCEFSRGNKLQTFAPHIFKDRSINVVSIDFDISKNRYLDPEVIQRKEALGIKEGLWTLEDSERLKRHHEFFQRKFDFLRKRQSEGLSHVDAVEEWFKYEKDFMSQLMPDHPLLQEMRGI